MTTTSGRTGPRRDGRAYDELRPVRFELGIQRHPSASCFVECGATRVVCAVSYLEGAPRWRGRVGWVTAEYAMLPGSTAPRARRETPPQGRSQEIQRLVGRSLRAVVDLDTLPDCTLTVDCDVLDADGGTRAAAITGGWVALARALENLGFGRAVVGQVAAVSVGIVGGQPMLDLTYDEDVTAEVDMNVVATADGRLVEIQGTAERVPFDRATLDRLITLGIGGCEELLVHQLEALGSSLPPPSRSCMSPPSGPSALPRETQDRSSGLPPRRRVVTVRIVLATRNRGKLAELRRILAGLDLDLDLDLDLELVPIDSLGGGSPEETGTTFEENALAKARIAVSQTGLPALADDSGLEVDALGGRPGVISARYAGPHADDAANRAKLLEALAAVPAEDRQARFICAAAFVTPDGREWSTIGIMEGRIINESRGEGGFGYDPVFVGLGETRTNAELPSEVKDARSHRGAAFRALRPVIQALRVPNSPSS